MSRFRCRISAALLRARYASGRPVPIKRIPASQTVGPPATCAAIFSGTCRPSGSVRATAPGRMAHRRHPASSPASRPSDVAALLGDGGCRSDQGLQPIRRLIVLLLGVGQSFPVRPACLRCRGCHPRRHILRRDPHCRLLDSAPLGKRPRGIGLAIILCHVPWLARAIASGQACSGRGSRRGHNGLPRRRGGATSRHRRRGCPCRG